ncbi:MAG: succinylglutamate desuccinylase/aspartoacylase family protein [Methanosphaera sp.]|uniref:succinylglutamate desuccinylase/aspartoacylase domain-containing protein n=1 Tax=Methanosphaera sp. ISO3-F5 TaxID=1452353 RepID=UPI002B25A4F3|nr:succinylglutamate desuccinylase/aspartoacylase family protein [Methanosphaera sp. ISO3-F5]MBR0473291.1 succinylglutamate desuccinylase/aspartoacylase family protein [Methanosphaera sp.]WQH63789.1 succinylglutamate desuccinylase/aspartoacylase family protein [Methanosphaera sp. ISO3-F5]
MKCKNCGVENDNNAHFCRNCGGNVFIDDNISPKRSFNPLLLVGLIIIVFLVAIGGVSAYIIYFDTSPVEIISLTNDGANVLENSELAKNMPQSEISEKVLAQAQSGVPIYKIGDGKGPVSVITAGVHGDQLNPSVAAMKIINYLDGRKIKGTVYVLPFTSPDALSKNTKLTNGVNLNQEADRPGTISYNVVQFAFNNHASAVGDFHETQVGKDPGQTTIMCTQVPTYASYQLATDMSSLSLDKQLTYLVAGITYDGAIEDELNLKGTPAVTPLVQVPGHGKVYQSSVDESFTQMLALLYVNGNLDSNDSYLKLANMDRDGL